MVTVWESARVMKAVLTILDMITIFFMWRWLRITGRPEWLVIGYAWNPLVILEVAHSGHVDALGAFWIVACAYAWHVSTATRRRRLHARGDDQAAYRSCSHRCSSDVCRNATSRSALPLWRSSTSHQDRLDDPARRHHQRRRSHSLQQPDLPAAGMGNYANGAAAFALFAGLATAAWARWRLR